MGSTVVFSTTYMYINKELVRLILFAYRRLWAWVFRGPYDRRQPLGAFLLRFSLRINIKTVLQPGVLHMYTIHRQNIWLNAVSSGDISINYIIVIV
jgi:hypothetical protein